MVYEYGHIISNLMMTKTRLTHGRLLFIPWLELVPDILVIKISALFKKQKKIDRILLDRM